MTEPTNNPAPSDFIRDIVIEDLKAGRHSQICTRFPPEPNGYLHIGHAKSICLNFGIAHEFGGVCNIRMDDTNPAKEETEFVDSIMADVRWLIDGWADKNLGGAPLYTSDYFDKHYEFAVELVRKGKAYVDEMPPDQTDEFRRLGRESPFRGRPVEENVDLFARMKAGEFPDGAKTLRAKIDMQAPNVWLRDPVIYEVHRPLYEWILESLELPPPLPRQIEFARLNLTYTVMSKRKLIQLVNERLVNGWDDPRMLTISGLRRRGVTASAIRAFVQHIGVTKYPSLNEMALLEHAVREEFNRTAPRRLAVLRPLKVVITNYPEGRVEELGAVNNPENPDAGSRQIAFTRELFIDSADFTEVPPPKYFRLKPGGEVRLKYAYIIKCDEVVKDAAGNVAELRCSADLESKSGGATSHRKIKGTIHWVSAARAIDAEVRLYDRLFTMPQPDADGGDFKSFLNPNSLEVVQAKCEPSLAAADLNVRYQFERVGYFALDPDSRPGKLVFNRTITLKDTWAKKSG